MNTKSILRDLRSFADSDEEVEIDNTGQVLLSKGGELYEFQLLDSMNSLHVSYKGKTLNYSEFIAKDLAKLDTFAQRILERRKSIEPYIDGPGTLTTPWSKEESTALKLLDEECCKALFSGTKVSFITADAGHGKTALLREYQARQAKKYLEGKSSFLFWHVDLQGRDLVRLAEAIMFDLGELRVSGLFFSSVLTLIRNNQIVLAIDGFDELAAEIGGDSAMGALSSFVMQMEESGTLIAASRRTFFDNQDYIKRTSLLKGSISQECVFNELKIQDWKREQVLEYLEYYYEDAAQIYKGMLVRLQSNSCHPILCRPFLLTKVVEGANLLGILPFEFMNEVEYGNEGVSSVVDSFTKREVIKWKERDKTTGKPYLTYENHIELLATVAREMWENQKDVITVEELEFWGVLLMDNWGVQEKMKPMIIRMLKSHALLVAPSDNTPNLRKFDHEEFKNYFLSRCFAKIVISSINSSETGEVKRFLYESQLPDSVAKYFIGYVGQGIDIPDILNLFVALIENEWKPTHLQSNVGTLIPYVLDGANFVSKIKLDVKAVYSSLIFEGKKISNVDFSHGTFVNVSLKSTTLSQVTFSHCTFSEISVETDSSNVFEGVCIFDSEIGSIVLYKNGEIIDTAFSPDRILSLLQSVGIVIKQREVTVPNNDYQTESRLKKCVNSFLSKFHKTHLQYEVSIAQQSVFGSRTKQVLTEVIPTLSKYGIIEEVDTKTTRQLGGKAWKLSVDLETLLSADKSESKSENGSKSETRLKEFWDHLNNI